MISKGKRREGQPIYINGEITQRLNRVSFSTKSFNEEWIQQLIHKQPNILPVDEIETNFSPLIPIGREVATNCGNIDNLFISPDGYLTIIETKLWRNPEARREVVGQILDYAKDVSKWTFTDLDIAVKNYNKTYNANNDGVLETISRYDPIDESDEQFLIDNISKNLKRGRFLLLIVGDGIRESVEDMVEYLSQSPQLYFTLALVELQVYRFDKEANSLIVIPQVITRTKEITRAIVRIESKNLEEVRIEVDTVEPEGIVPMKNSSKRFTITEEDFFNQLHHNVGYSMVEFAKQIISDCESRGYLIDWAQGSFVVKFRDPIGSGTKITLFVVEKRGSVYLGWAADQLLRSGINPEISWKYALNTSKLFKNLGVHPKHKNVWSKNKTLTELKPIYDRFLLCVENFVAEIESNVKPLE